MYIHTRAGSVQNIDREVKKCLLESFKRTDEEFLKKAADASPTWKDGYMVVTVCCVLTLCLHELLASQHGFKLHYVTTAF